MIWDFVSWYSSDSTYLDMKLQVLIHRINMVKDIMCNPWDDPHELRIMQLPLVGEKYNIDSERGGKGEGERGKEREFLACQPKFHGIRNTSWGLPDVPTDEKSILICSCFFTQQEVFY